MKTTLIWLLLLAACPAFADHIASSLGIFAGNLEYDQTDVPAITVTNVEGKYGLHFSPNMSVELRIGFAKEENEVNDLGNDFQIELDYYTSVYIKDALPLTNWFELYALLGYTRAKLLGTVTSADGTFSDKTRDTDSDLSYGLGATFRFSDSIISNLEWKRLIDGDLFEISGFALGLAYKF